MKRTILAALAPGLLACQTPIASPPSASVDRFEEVATAEAGARVRLSGTLENAGSNYFTDMRLVLKDEATGQFIYVRPWLPRETRPSPTGQVRASLSSVLGRTVELEGVISDGPVKNLGAARHVEVSTARVIEAGDKP